MFAAFIGFVFCLGAQTARAQNIQPFVDCIERERDASGVLTGKYIAHFGYINYGTTAFIPINSAGNILVPVRNPPNQPNNFLPGIHPRALSVTLDPSVIETWHLSAYSLTVSFDSLTQMCFNDNANSSSLMTYQGKLSDGAAAANGIYDLQFQLFNAAAGGAARTTPITVEDVPIVNGLFAVQLNLGKYATVNPTGRDRSLNAALLAGEDGFFEIGVRPGNLTGAFTVLTPRQPLTAVPLAMRAVMADEAFRAVFADESKIRQSSAPSSYDCSAVPTYGRQLVDPSTSRLYICTSGGWKFVTLQSVP